MIHTPKLIALETTRKCHLSCKHCRADASRETDFSELTFEEITNIFDNLITFARPIIILTGGDPLTRHDIFDIAKYGSSIGLKMVLASCGYDIDEDIINNLRESGVMRLSFSLDAATPQKHDAFRGEDGSFRHVLDAIEICRRERMPFQINTTVSKMNMDELERIILMSIHLGAVSFHPFFLVPTGRAKNLKGLEMSPAEYETMLHQLRILEGKYQIEIKPTCAPHYHRIAAKHSRGCLAGTGFAFISHVGKVQTCGFLDVECGDLRTDNYNFKKIWETSSILNELRAKENYTGKCGDCNYHTVCGGCRARAYEVGGDYMGEEPYCSYNSSPPL